MDLAGKDFWDGFWHRQDGRRFAGLSHFQSQMSGLLARYARPGTVVCEIGCGGSTWMPELAARGVDVWGIDYSDAGLELARRNLERNRTTATLIKADVRDAGALPAATFDVIFSSGFIEHFDDAPDVLRTISRWLRPGGVMITIVPNFTAWWGRLQRKVDRRLFNLHTVYSPAELDAIHAAAGLASQECAAFFGGFGPLVVNYTRPLTPLPAIVRSAVVGTLWTAQQFGAWSFAAVGHRDNRLYSSHVCGIYRSTR